MFVECTPHNLQLRKRKRVENLEKKEKKAKVVEEVVDEHPYTFHLTFWLTMLVCNQGDYMVTR